MKVYCLNDESYDSDYYQGYDWVAYWYEDGDYEGSGEAVALKDGLLYFKNLGHCSCYGPFEGGFDGGGVSIEQFKGNLDSIHSYISYKELQDKVLELIS